MNTTDNDSKLSHDEIANCAYLLWESNGRPEGRDAEYWYQAQKTLKARTSSSATASSAPRPAATSPGAAPKANTTSPKTEDSRKRKQNANGAGRQPAFA